MKTVISITPIIVLLTLASTARAADEDGFVPMFNGTDLTGWEGQPDAWQVGDGTIIGESTLQKPCEKTHYLYWTGGEPGDFIMRCEIKLTGGNSGIQFRSEKRPDFNTFGYQADFTGGKLAGCLYQHGRGAVVLRGMRADIAEDGTRAEKPFATVDELAKKVKNEDWNVYEIVAQGSKVALRLNGELMCEVDDRDRELSCRKGIIALQMHKGPPMKVQFRNLRIKLLD
jgi:hypothetical protein